MEHETSYITPAKRLGFAKSNDLWIVNLNVRSMITNSEMNCSVGVKDRCVVIDNSGWQNWSHSGEFLFV